MSATSSEKSLLSKSELSSYYLHREKSYEDSELSAIQEKIYSCRLSVTNIWKPEAVCEDTSLPGQNLIPSPIDPFEHSNLRDGIEFSSPSSSVYTDSESETDIHSISFDDTGDEEEDLGDYGIYDFPVSHTVPRPLKSSLAGSRQSMSCSPSSLSSDIQTSQSSNKKLTFLTTLEAIPKELEMLTLKRLAKTIHTSLHNPKVLYPSLTTFSRLLQDVCSRANYWSWAPNFMMFLALFINGDFGKATNDTVARCAMYLFSYFCCSICNYNPEREPPLYGHFVYFFIPQLFDTIGKWSNSQFDPSLLTLSYVFLNIPIDKEIIKAVIAIREEHTADFSLRKQEDLRYQRALWLSAISHQLMLSIERGENLKLNKANILLCYKEAMLSYHDEKSHRVAKVYEEYFDIKSNELRHLFKTDHFIYQETIVKFPQMIVAYLNQLMEGLKPEQPRRVATKIKRIFRSEKKLSV